MYTEKQREILISLSNILEAKEDIVRNAIYAENNDNYKKQYIKMKDEASVNLQINLVRFADAIEVSRNEMPGVYPEYFDYNLGN